MAERLRPVPQVRAGPGWATCIVAGAGAGVVAALASVGAEIVMRVTAVAVSLIVPWWAKPKSQ